MKAAALLPPFSFMPEGTVVKIVRSIYQVRIDQQVDPVSAILPGKHKKQIKSTHSLVNVGDRVSIRLSGKDWIIEKIGQRKNKISRISPQNRNDERILVTNVDQMLIVASAINPEINPRLLDRYLVVARKFNIDPVIVVTKTDLLEDLHPFKEKIINRFKNCQIKIEFVSLLDEGNKKTVANLVKNKVNAVVGSSGVGKSSLITLIDEQNRDIRIGEISKSHNKGTHTTTTVEMYYLSSLNAYLVDTPGIREFGLFDVSKDELWRYFPDFTQIISECKFNNCQHIREPGCAIKSALDNHELNSDRYVSYKNIYYSLDDVKRRN